MDIQFWRRIAQPITSALAVATVATSLGGCAAIDWQTTYDRWVQSLCRTTRAECVDASAAVRPSGLPGTAAQPR